MTESPFASNPYVGARPFRSGELYFGRDQEVSDLCDLLVASRIVLMHSPSGAGKTSLIQAGVVPALQDEFQVCGVQDASIFSALRVNRPVPPGLAVTNRYVYSLVTCLLGKRDATAEEMATMTLTTALARRRDGAPREGDQLVVVDQLEEVLTLDPTDLTGQRHFFDQLGEALEDSRRWTLLAMREDYIGGLDQFLIQIPGRLRATYRLDFLDLAEAREAIVEPSNRRGVTFEDTAAGMLIDELRTTKVQGPDHAPEPRLAPYVEPVLLQVVCHRLWGRLAKRPDREAVITTPDVADLGGVAKALRNYYSDIVKEAAPGSTRRQRVIRDWVESHLITEQRYRSQTRIGPRVPEAEDVLDLLQRRYLIRSDPRTELWWELSHDSLIEPVIEDNTRWRTKSLAPWQLAADAWSQSHDDGYLLTLDELRQLKRDLGKRDDETLAHEQEFITRSDAHAAEASNLERLRAGFDAVKGLLVISLFVNLLWLLSECRS